MKSVTHRFSTKTCSHAIPHAMEGTHFKRHPFLSMSISKRLALGFLIPVLVVFLGMGSIGLQSEQLLMNVSTFNQHLLHAYTSLTGNVGTLQQIHTNILGALNDANKPQTLPQTLSEDQLTSQHLMNDYDTALNTYLSRDILSLSPQLSTLFKESGHDTQLDQQRTLSNTALKSWHAYKQSLSVVLATIMNNQPVQAQTIERDQVEPSYANAMTALLSLIQFTGNLVPSIHDATQVEINRLITVMGISFAALLVGIALVACLVTTTIVQRLRRFRSVVQAVERGLFSARIEVAGRDEIALVSRAVNTTLDTVVGLLEETRQQRDELAKGEELKRLHGELQREHEALNAANSRLATLASTDVLTNLPNHRALQALLEQECERARRFGRPLSLLFFDGDRFKQVNDTYGHAVGDAVLRELGGRASSVLRAGDTVGRFGGEEFLVLLPETDEQEAQLVAERLRSAVAVSPLATHDVEDGIAVTVSIGVACYPKDGNTASEVREQADQAMYWAKRLGRNQVRTAAEAERANRDAALKAATAHALERQELVVQDGRDAEQQVRVEQLRLVYSLMAALDWREPGISTHSHEVSDLVVSMARILEFDEKRTMRAATAAFLHDIGKIALPDRLLNQPRNHFNMLSLELPSLKIVPGSTTWLPLFVIIMNAGMGLAHLMH